MKSENEKIMMNWTLQAISNELNGQNITLDRDMLVGRHQDCDIVLQSSEISRRHAAFHIKDDTLWLEDLKSSNGTFVNDLRIEEPTRLKNNDVIQFANLRFSLVAPVPQNEPTAQEIKEAEQVLDQGIPTLEERAKETPISQDGVPQHVDIPKPAPIPEHVDLEVQPQPKTTPQPQNSEIAKEVEQQKNASVGLITVIILVLIAAMVWFFFFR